MIGSGSGGRVRINPFACLFCLYFFANLYSSILVFGGSSISVDQLFVGFDFGVAIDAFILLQLTFVFMLLLYCVSVRIPVGNGVSLSESWGLGVLLYQLGYLANSFIYNVNIAGVQNEISSPFQAIFSLLDPDTIFFVVAVLLRSSGLFWVNVVVYLISSVLRGWGGGFVLIPILLLCKYYQFGFKRSSLFIVALVGIALLLFSPFLIEIKWLIRAGLDVGLFYSNVLDVGYTESLLRALEYILNRFQIFGHVSLIVENRALLEEAYLKGEYIPYWADGVVQWAFLKLNQVDIFQINRYIVSYFFDSDNSAYSTNPGLAGWVSVLGSRSIFFILYVSLIVLVPAYFIRRYAGGALFLLCYCFSLVWLFHGWIGAYFNFIAYALCVLFFGKFKFSIVKKNRVE